jgi:hypothetical protein
MTYFSLNLKIVMIHCHIKKKLKPFSGRFSMGFVSVLRTCGSEEYSKNKCKSDFT